MREALREVDRNKLALALSVLPGLGHLVKGYVGIGLAIMIAGNALVVFAALWLALATLGFSLVVLPVLWVICIAWSAYLLPDRHHGGKRTPPVEMTESGEIKPAGAGPGRGGRA